MNELTVVIVSYNSREFLDECLRRVEAEKAVVPLQTVVVDNASTDMEVASLGLAHPGVRFIANSSNLGFSKGCNIGIRACPAPFYLLLNPDCMIWPGSIKRCLDVLRSQPEAGIAGCRVENPDGSLQLACRRSIPTLGVALPRILGLTKLFPRSRTFGRYNFTFMSDLVTHEVEAVSGSFLMFRSQVLDQIGGLDERFFLYGEDLDFCFEALKRGWRILYIADSRVTHYKRQSSRTNADVANYHFYDAMKLFYRKHFGERRWRLGAAVVASGVEVAYRLSEVRRRLRASHDIGSKG